MDPLVYSVIVGFLTIATLSSFRSLKSINKMDWEHIVKPAMNQKHSQEGVTFYERNIKVHIEENKEIFDRITEALNINQEATASKIYQADSKWNAEIITVIRVFGVIFGIPLGLLFLLMFDSTTPFFACLGGAVLSYIYPELALKERIEKRKKEIKKNLPDFLDLLVVLLEVGTNPQDGILQVSQNFKGAIGDEFKRAAIASKYNGGQWQVALTEMADRVKIEELSDLVSAMALASEKGTPLAPVLREQTSRVRFKQQQDYEEKASKMSVKMLPIMGMFIFIPLLVLLLAPAFTQSV